MQIEVELRKMQNAIAALDEKIDSISGQVDEIHDDIENADYGMEVELEGIQTKLDVFLGYPLTHISGLHRRIMQKHEPGMYKKVIEAEEAAGMPPWIRRIEREDYIKMLKKGYGARKNSNIQNDGKEPAPADSVDKKAIICHALTIPKTTKEISAETGIPERTVYRILHAMFEAGEIKSDNGRPEKFMVANPSLDPLIEVTKA